MLNQKNYFFCIILVSLLINGVQAPLVAVPQQPNIPLTSIPLTAENVVRGIDRFYPVAGLALSVAVLMSLLRKSVEMRLAGKRMQLSTAEKNVLLFTPTLAHIITEGLHNYSHHDRFIHDGLYHEKGSKHAALVSVGVKSLLYVFLLRLLFYKKARLADAARLRLRRVAPSDGQWRHEYRQPDMVQKNAECNAKRERLAKARQAKPLQAKYEKLQEVKVQHVQEDTVEHEKAVARVQEDKVREAKRKRLEKAAMELRDSTARLKQALKQAAEKARQNTACASSA